MFQAYTRPCRKGPGTADQDGGHDLCPDQADVEAHEKGGQCKPPHFQCPGHDRAAHAEPKEIRMGTQGIGEHALEQGLRPGLRDLDSLDPGHDALVTHVQDDQAAEQGNDAEHALKISQLRQDEQGQQDNGQVP